MSRITQLLAVLAVMALLAGCKQSGTTGGATTSGASTSTGTSATTATSTTAATTTAGVTTLALPGAPITGISEQMRGGMKMYDMVAGVGTEAKSGMMVKIAYSGWLTDGTPFDSSVGKNDGYSLRLGNAEVIKGWDEGIVGMKVGGKRKLVIPPDMAYGAQGYPGAIPPNSTLVFDLELVDAH
jgi:FKBP-type peptidyl-prolyl cis-trans isomerase